MSSTWPSHRIAERDLERAACSRSSLSSGPDPPSSSIAPARRRAACASAAMRSRSPFCVEKRAASPNVGASAGHAERRATRRTVLLGEEGRRVHTVVDGRDAVRVAGRSPRRVRQRIESGHGDVVRDAACQRALDDAVAPLAPARSRLAAARGCARSRRTAVEPAWAAQPADEARLEAVRMHQVELARADDASQRRDRARVLERVQRPGDRDRAGR